MWYRDFQIFYHWYHLPMERYEVRHNGKAYYFEDIEDAKLFIDDLCVSE